MSILDIAPLELARQLTIVESGFFQRVQPSECLNKAWNGDNGDKLAPNVRSVIRTANILSGWVGTTCLSSRDPKQRARVMKHYVQIAIVSFFAERQRIPARILPRSLLIAPAGITKPQQLLFHGRNCCWLEHSSRHPTETLVGAMQPEDSGPKGGRGQDAGLDEKLFKLQGYVEDYQSALRTLFR